MLAEARAEAVLGEDVRITDRFHGRDMLGAGYEPPFAVHRHRGVRPQGPHARAGRLRERRGRHRRRAHVDLVRRGRLPDRARAGHPGRQPGAARRHLRGAHGPVRRPLGEGGRPRHRRGAAGERPAAARRALPALLPALLALRHAAALLRQAVLVHPHLGAARPPAGRQRDDRLAPRAHQARALRQVAGEQRRLGDLARALLGHAAARCGATTPARRWRSARSTSSSSSAACGSRTRTGRSSTRSRSRRRPAASRCAACPR